MCVLPLGFLENVRVLFGRCSATTCQPAPSTAVFSSPSILGSISSSFYAFAFIFGELFRARVPRDFILFAHCSRGCLASTGLTSARLLRCRSPSRLIGCRRPASGSSSLLESIQDEPKPVPYFLFAVSGYGRMFRGIGVGSF